MPYSAQMPGAHGWQHCVLDVLTLAAYGAGCIGEGVDRTTGVNARRLGFASMRSSPETSCCELLACT